jgi:CBS domain containing-hemolysin-like protein
LIGGPGELALELARHRIIGVFDLLTVVVPTDGGGSGSLTLLIVYVALAIVVSFMCSIMEAVLLSVTPAYVGALEAEKPEAARRLRELKDDVDRPLAAILTLNTVSHTIGAAGAGAQAAAYFGSGAIGVFSAVLTLGILVLSEIIPKTLGAVYWRGLAPLVSRMLKPLIYALFPLVLMSQWFAKLLTRGEKTGDVSRQELAALADIGAKEGVFEPREARLFKSLLRFESLQVSDVMTPRTVLVAFAETATVQELMDAKHPFSRYPVFSEGRDDITGYVLLSDALTQVANDAHDTSLATLRRDLVVVPQDQSLLEIFEHLVDGREHIAIVIDEYGGTAGIVTMEDVIETLLGLEITDENDTTEDMRVLARDQWRVRASQLGIADQKERDSAIRFGLTGGEPPHAEPSADASGSA